MKSNKRWVISFILILVFFLITAGALVIVVDPFLHYHKPLKSLFYSLDDTTSTNDGIAKFFEYDAVITGTSMTQNFKPSEADRLFNINSVKLPIPGAPYKDINALLKRVLSYNPKVKYIFRGLDTNMISSIEWGAPLTYPTYLYDNDIMNDIHYIFNKDVVLKKCIPMLMNKFIHGKRGGGYVIAMTTIHGSQRLESCKS